MFDTLLELATNDQQNTDEEIRALASACLLSLSVAYGDTGEEIDSSFFVPVRKSNLVKITCLWYLIDEGTGINILTLIHISFVVSLPDKINLLRNIPKFNDRFFLSR